MIYRKGASFPHPVYYEDTSSYKKCIFNLEITNLGEDKYNYIFTFEYELGSPFLKNLLNEDRAFLNIIIQSNDSFYKRIHKYKNSFKIPKSRLSLNNRTQLQLQIQSNDEITFSNMYELNTFYDEFKDDILVPKNSLLGFSNTVRYDGEGNKPLLLFEYKTDPELDSDFKVELTPEVIVLIFKEEQYLMKEYNKNLSNMYVYAGLSQALTDFIYKHGKDEEYVDLHNIVTASDQVLDQKLIDLLESKQISEISLEEIDTVIYKITDNIIKKYVDAVREVSNYEY